MALTVAKGSTDTAMTFSPDTVSLAHLNWAADWQVQSEKPGEIVYINANSPSDQIETIRLSYQRVPNIYAGLGVDPKFLPPVRSGVKVYVELRQMWKTTSSTDDTFQVLSPLRTGTSVTIPDYAPVTGLNDYSDIEAFVRRGFSAIYSPGGLTQVGLKKLLRGILKKV